MKYLYKNLNPYDNHVNDCVYRALAYFLDITWRSAVRAVVYHAIKDGYVNFSYTTNIVSYLENQDYERHKAPKKGITVSEFEEYIKPNKVYIIHVKKPQHLTIVETNHLNEAAIIDIWDCGQCVMDWYFEKDK